MTKKFFKKENCRRGAAALLTTLLILTILLFIILGLSAIFVNELKLSSMAGRTAAAFYAAESGIEHALYQISKGVTSGSASGTLTNSKASYEASWSATMATSLGRYGNTRRKVDINFTPQTFCGDGTCGAGETCSSCQQDCGVCADCGSTSATTKTSCLAIKNDPACSALPSGTYWIKPSGSAFQVYCEMESSGGGWTRCMNNYDYYTKEGGATPGDFWGANPSDLYVMPAGDPVTQAYDFCAKAYGSAYSVGQQFLIEYRIGATDGVWNKTIAQIGTVTSNLVSGKRIADCGPTTYPVPDAPDTFTFRQTSGATDCSGYVFPMNWGSRETTYSNGCNIYGNLMGQPDDDTWSLHSWCKDYKWCYFSTGRFTGLASNPVIYQARGYGISVYYR
jgi:hypothetical protein